VQEFASLSIKNEGHVAMPFPDRLFMHSVRPIPLRA
jgi:hypothetical protein